MKLYVYDHCPYCVKARMIFGLKHVEFDLEFLLNDDEKTPIEMVGQKMVPILELDNGKYMPESMDIVHYIDSEFSKHKIVNPSSNGKIIDWIDETTHEMYQLAMPRWVQVDLPEFRTRGAIEYFIKKKEKYVGPFEELLQESDRFIESMNKKLIELDKLIHSEDSAEGKLSDTDFHLFAELRSLSIVKGIIFPKKTLSYLHKMHKMAKIPLHDEMAI
ncbi:MAG: glutaredoxin 2 [Rickettsiales bacterium]